MFPCGLTTACNSPDSLVRRPLYVGPDGEWYLVSDLFEVAVVHGANPASGRQIERLQIAEFLSAGNGPQHELRLSGAWVDEQSILRPQGIKKPWPPLPRSP
jgi:hypothetical protein